MSLFWLIAASTAAEGESGGGGSVGGGGEGGGGDGEAAMTDSGTATLVMFRPRILDSTDTELEFRLLYVADAV